MNKETIKHNLISKGVLNLKEFGCPEVNSENILKDYLYGNIFKKMLKDSLDNSSGELKEAIEELLTEITLEEI